MLTERSLRRLVVLAANTGAAGTGFGVAWLLGFRPWGIPLLPVAGALGWFAGWFAGRLVARRLSRVGYAPAGRLVYRLRNLPTAEVSAGGKARALARLVRAGQRVPEGFVVLPRAFDGDRLTPQAAVVVRTELSRLGSGERFAVRSSATAEDSAATSFAGAYESVLDVSADGVEAAIGAVRRSGASGRVAAYSEATGARPDEVAVVVQVLVRAEQAGVLFTVDPISGDLERMVGSSVIGLGEGLVSGADTGEQFTLVRPGGEYRGPDRLAPFAAALHTEAHLIEGTFGGVPQDIEWAIAGDRLWILQSRPVTTLNPWQPRTAEWNDTLAGNCLWSGTNLSEANPEAQTPLTISLARFQQANGGPSMALRGREMAGCIGGRPYANLTVQITARRGKAGKDDPRTVYRKLAGWWGELPAEVPVPVLPMTARDWSDAGLPLLGSLVRLGWTRLRLPGFLRSHRDRCAELTRRIADCRRPEELLRLWQAELFGFGIGSFWAVIAAGSEYPARLEVELRERLGAADSAALMSNLSGLSGGLESLGPAAGLREVLTGRMSRDDYVARFGHRGVNEVELAWPRPAEDPAWLDRMLVRAQDGTDLEASRHRQEQVYRATLARLAAGDPGLARRVARKLRRAARHASLREAVRSEGVRTTGVLRRFALRAGELLGVGEDVFLLTIEELVGALAGRPAPTELFEGRRAAHERQRQLPPLPAVVFGRFDPFEWAADPARRTDVFIAGAGTVPSAPAGEVDVVTGYPGAVGEVEGLVRRLDRLEEIDLLQRGEILVTSLTNIGWTPLFPRAGAIVTDLGAPLSHAAIVARELGIPAVVGCRDATARLATGDRVVVNGALGTVTVRERRSTPGRGADLVESGPRPAAG